MPDKKNSIKPGHHRPKLHEPRLSGLSAEAWSYPARASRKVFVQLLQHGQHVVTVSVRVPR